jgi:quinol monooxygenase YgiN
MYGTVARMKVKPGELEQLQKMLASDPEKADGQIAVYAYQLDNDPNQLLVVAVFRDKKSYMANADDPKTDEWFQQVRAHLESDPEWNDGEIIYSN